MSKTLHIKKNDTVKILSGAEKDKVGKVLKVNPTTNRVLVEGLNIMKRHTKPNATYPQGGIIEKEAAIHASNLILVCPKCGGATRLSHKMITDEKTGTSKSKRACKKCGELID